MEKEKIIPFNVLRSVNKNLSFDYKKQLHLDMFRRNPFVKFKNFLMNWYYMPEVKYNICYYSYNKEFAVLVPEYFKQYLAEEFSGIRKLKVNTVNNFDGMLKITGFNRLTNHLNNSKYNDLYKIFNLYYSMASFKEGVPFRYEVDKEYLDDWYKNRYVEEMTGYDFFIDIDCKKESDFKYACDSVLNITKLFNDINIPYEIRFSGYGFHIVTPSEFIETNLSFNPTDNNNIYRVFSKIAVKLSKEYSDMIDKALYDSKRILKVPYSLAIYDFEEIFVCYPIHSINDIKNFDINNYKIENINKTYLKNRRSNIFNKSGNFNNLLKHFNLNE